MPHLLLAFVYHPRSFGILDLHAAARSLCLLLWVVDRRLAETESMLPMLGRLGTVVDVTDLSPEDAAARIAEHRPDGILALADGLLERTAGLAERLELPFLAPATAHALADKHAQRAALRAAGLRTPGSWRIPAAGDRHGWAGLVRAARFPAVVKPRRSEASRNTQRVESPAALSDVVAEIADAAPADRDALVLEEYIPDRAQPVDPRFADYVSVESVVSGGRVTHLGVNGRLPPAEPFRETGFFLPSALPADRRTEVVQLATDAIAALGVHAGCLHTEIKLTPEGPVVIEVNGRIGGGVCEMVRRVGGWELMPVALRLALAEDVEVAPLPRDRLIAYDLLVQPPQDAVRVTSLDGVEAVRALPEVEAVTVNRGVGAAIDWRAGTNEYVLQVEGVVTDHDALPALLARVEELAKIGYAYEDGSTLDQACA